MYVADQSWRGFRGLGCTPVPGTDVCFEATSIGTPNQAAYTTDPNVTTLIDPYGWFGIDAGHSGAAAVRTAASGGGSGSWLQKNGVMLGVGLAVAAVVFGTVKR